MELLLWSEEEGLWKGLEGEGNDVKLVSSQYRPVSVQNNPVVILQQSSVYHSLGLKRWPMQGGAR